MLKKSANLTTVFPRVSFFKRFAAAKKAGFDGVTLGCPYEYHPFILAEYIEEFELNFVTCNHPDDEAANNVTEYAILDPSRRSQFLEGLDVAIEYARALSALHISCSIGDSVKPLQRDVLLDNLTVAADLLNAFQMKLLLRISCSATESSKSGFDRAIAVITSLNATNIALQVDLDPSVETYAVFDSFANLISHVNLVSSHAGSKVHRDNTKSVVRRLQSDCQQRWITYDFLPGILRSNVNRL